MPVITIFNGIYCNETAVIHDIKERTGYRLVTDDTVVETASELAGMKKDKIETAFSSKTSVFNRFTHEKERAIAYLRLAVSKLIVRGNTILTGYSSLLPTKEINHLLRVCIIEDTASRIEAARQSQGLSAEEAAAVIASDDRDRSAWTETLFSVTDPWEPSLYDMVLSPVKTDPGQAVAMIEENLLKPTLRQTPDSVAAVDDFVLAAASGAILADAGHDVNVTSKNGALLITINKKVLMLNRLEDELKAIARDIPGVESVETRVEPNNQTEAVYRKHAGDLPSKVLLVDDEREFVQTLSERLQMRDMGCVAAFDGASALDLVRNDDPEVMILDLKMPGIDGMEVLNRVKEIRPEIEVIVLTGHGSEQDKQDCLSMGAFAYMQKPIDINTLSQLLKDAHQKYTTDARMPI